VVPVNKEVHVDPVLAAWPRTELDQDLWRIDPGIAALKDMTPVEYGAEYFHKYQEYDNSIIAVDLNDFRCKLVRKYCGTILDIGVGSLIFMKNVRIPAWGYDINPVAEQRLRETGSWTDPYRSFQATQIDGWSMWDVLEHIEEPSKLLTRMVNGQYLFLSLPIFENLEPATLRGSRHFKPEHFYYFTTEGLAAYMTRLGFQQLEQHDFETQLGRDAVGTFVYRVTR
jgi:hypothetical protein